MIQDTHHPTLRGQVALGEAVLRELAQRKALGTLSGDGPLDPVVCAAHFGMDGEKWARMCDSTSEHYRRVAGYRYDSTARMEKSRRYAEAARLLRSGVPVERVGMPGIGAGVPEREAVVPDGSTRDRESRGEKRNDLERTASARRHGRNMASVVHALDLPVLEQDGCAAAEESHGGHEVVAVSAADDFSRQPGERSIQDSHGRPDGQSRLFSDDQPRIDHGMDLTEVAGQRRLIDNFQDLDDSVAVQGDQPVLGATLQKHVARKERND